MLDLTKQYIRNPNIIIKSIGGKQFALNADNGSEYSVNGVSYDMLELLAKPQTGAELLEVMLGQYDVSRERLASDVEVWLADALQKELVQQVVSH